MQNIFHPSHLLLAAAFAAAVGLTGCTNETGRSGAALSESTSAKSSDSANAILLRRFDSLDYQMYSKQNWEGLRESHADNIVVHYPDGHTTTGLHDHIEALKPQFVFAPDTRILEHPIKFGSNGEWTSVIGTMEGTFTQPMDLGNGKVIPPNGKKFKLSMCTVGHWKNGKMDEEYLFWDNQSFMKQIGLAQ